MYSRQLNWTNIQIHSASLTSLVSIHLLIHLSTHLCHHRNAHHPLFLHSFTPGSNPTFLTNPSQLNTPGTPGLPSRSWDRTKLIMLIGLFLVCFPFKLFCLFCVVD